MAAVDAETARRNVEPMAIAGYRYFDTDDNCPHCSRPLQDRAALQTVEGTVRPLTREGVCCYHEDCPQ